MSQVLLSVLLLRKVAVCLSANTSVLNDFSVKSEVIKNFFFFRLGKYLIQNCQSLFS